MIRKSLIALCLLAFLATLALWAESFRPRFVLADLEAKARQAEPQGRRTKSPPESDEGWLLELVYTANAEADLFRRRLGRFELEIARYRLMVPERSILPENRFAHHPSHPGFSPLTPCDVPGTLHIAAERDRPSDVGPAVPPRHTEYSVSKCRMVWTTVGPANAFYWCTIALPLWWLSVPPFLTAGFLSIKPLKQRHRRRRGLCAKCAYDLRGSTSDRCPECGTEIAGRTQRAEP